MQKPVVHLFKDLAIGQRFVFGDERICLSPSIPGIFWDRGRLAVKVYFLDLAKAERDKGFDF